MTDATEIVRKDPAWPLTISRELWDAFADTFSPEFADSWLYGAKVVGKSLIPRTQTGYRKLVDCCFISKSKSRGNSAGGNILAEFGLDLAKPLPFHLSGQPSAIEEMPYLYDVIGPKRKANG